MSGNSQSDPKRVTKNFRSDLDRASLNKTRDKHTDLNGLIDVLSDKLTIVANSQEKEFLSAYRVHMLGVQLELKELKLKVAKAELSLQDDGEVSKLEDECNWFRTETNRLNAHCSSMQSDIGSMKNRLTTLRDQNEFLSSQLKAVMKRSRVIEVELEYNQQEREDRRHIIESNGGGDDDTDYAEYDERSDALNHQGPTPSEQYQQPPVVGNVPLGKSTSAIQLGGKNKNKPRKMNRTATHTGGVRQLDAPPPPSDILKQAPGRSKRPPSPSQMKDDFMSFGMTQGEKVRMGDPVKLANHLRQLNELRDGQSQVEIELEECLKVKFEEIVGRRSKIIMENSKNRYIKNILKSMDGSRTQGSDASSQMMETLDSASFNSVIPNEKKGNPVYGGISGLGLEYLTDSDRKDVMVNMLTNPVIFEELVNSLQGMLYTHKYGGAV